MLAGSKPGMGVSVRVCTRDGSRALYVDGAVVAGDPRRSVPFFFLLWPTHIGRRAIKNGYIGLKCERETRDISEKKFFIHSAK